MQGNGMMKTRTGFAANFCKRMKQEMQKNKKTHKFWGLLLLIIILMSTFAHQNRIILQYYGL